MKTQSIQITLGYLEDICKEARSLRKNDSSLSNTVVISTVKPTNGHIGSDEITVWIKSLYSECNGKMLF